jgi:hypothetical protein
MAKMFIKIYFVENISKGVEVFSPEVLKITVYVRGE